MKRGHGPAPIHMAKILVIILATNSNLHSTCCTLIANILFYYMRHVSLRYFTSSDTEGGGAPPGILLHICKRPIVLSWLISCFQSIIL